MITKKDLLTKCQSFPELVPLAPIISPRDFSQVELEAIDFIIESFISLKETTSMIAQVTVNKLEIWLASTKDRD